MKLSFANIWQSLLPQHMLTFFAGKLADCKTSWVKNFLIDWFIEKYHVKLDEAEEANPHNYKNFNSFFTRALKAGARQINTDAASVISPVDGVITKFGCVKNSAIIQAKKFDFSLQQIIGDKMIAENFVDGNFSTIYLSPSDYHRVHMPINGKLVKMLYIPGDLFSVNTANANKIPNLFARNERIITVFETECGLMAMILIGAIIVGSIETVWSGAVTSHQSKKIKQWNYSDQNIELLKGDEMGRFKLGSTVILLFQKKSIQWNPHIQENDAVKMGESIGRSFQIQALPIAPAKKVT